VGGDGGPELYEPPMTEGDFGRLALRLAACAEITRLLAGA
jgi:hypothetical protein